MPTPLPDEDQTDLDPPDAAEVAVLSRGVLSAVTPTGGRTAIQQLLVESLFVSMTGHPATLDVDPLGAREFGRALARRNLEFRTRIVQLMVLLALVVRPLPTELTEQVGDYARELSVQEGMLEVAGRFAHGSLGLAAVDFERNGYTSDWHPEDARVLHTSRALSTAWEETSSDPGLADRWAALEDLPGGTLGRSLTEFYRARGFAYPGLPGSAPPLLAQHDWVHVVADYGTTVESELEDFALIARANDDMRAVSLLAMVVSLFETGYLRTGAGLFEYSTGHLSGSGMAVRVADAMLRGARCHGSIDFLRTDWFEPAALPDSEVRDRFGLTPKSDAAVAAGSVGPWEPGGISPFQAHSGRTAAAAAGRTYDPCGAVAPPGGTRGIAGVLPAGRSTSRAPPTRRGAPSAVPDQRVYPLVMASDPHPPSAGLGYLGVTEILDGFADGSLTSAELVDGLLDRIAVLDDPAGPVGLRAVAALAADARQVAAERDAERGRGQVRGPLHGVPVLVKDNIEVTGLPGAAGSTALAGRPAVDAPLVTRLRAAGAVIVGSTNLSEWANIRSERSTSGWSATGGLVGNPWALDRSAGGSSSGSGAAVAAGLAPLAVGTETDGSIVCPASLNGVVGLKPTVGSVPTVGVVPISASQDSAGPMGRTVDDVARLYSVLAGREPEEPTAAPRFVHAVTWRTGHPATDTAVASAVGALGGAGHHVESREVATPGPEVVNDEFQVLLAELVDDLGAYLDARPGDGVRSLVDVIEFERAHADVELPWFGNELFTQALGTGGRAGAAYAGCRSRNLDWAVGTCLGPGLDGADVLVAAAYGPAWKSDLVVGGHAGVVSSWVTTPAAIAGWPILSVPVGLVHGLPVGLALVARPGEEWMLLAAGRRVESVVASAGPLPRPAFVPPVRG